MAAAAAERSEERFAPRRHRRLRVVRGEPALELCRIERDDPSDHARVIGAAVLGAEQMIVAGMRRGEPQDRIAAGKNILLETKGWNVEAVDRVLRSHHELHRNTDGNMQLVDFATTAISSAP